MDKHTRASEEKETKKIRYSINLSLRSSDDQMTHRLTLHNLV